MGKNTCPVSVFCIHPFGNTFNTLAAQEGEAVGAAKEAIDPADEAALGAPAFGEGTIGEGVPAEDTTGT